MLALNIPGEPRHIAVALSGGPDSWALALLAQQWCQRNNGQLTALTVDHRLRDDSTAEAQTVAAECARRGLAHHVLTWQHGPITSALQEQARTARYAMLTDWCRANQADILLTAHHADDQAETVLLRLAKASDIAGLAGLRSASTINGVTVVRPLLEYAKQQLVDYATQAGVAYVTDSSNENPRFARARLRQARMVLEAEGLTTANVTRLAGKMRAADEALIYAAQALITATYAADGTVRLPLVSLASSPPALALRALDTAWRAVTGATGHPLAHDQLQHLVDYVTTGAKTKITLGGMVLEREGSDLLVCREYAACAKPLTVQAYSNAVWDNRFNIHNPTGSAVAVQALGTFGRDRINALAAPYAWLHDVPAAARAALPAVVVGATALPLLLAKTQATPWAAFLPVFLSAKSTDTALYSA